MTKKQAAAEFAAMIKSFGLRAFIAERGTYGFVTDAEGSRVMSFSFSDGLSLSGNYGPPSRESGTGWQLEATSITSHDDAIKALYETAPRRMTGNGWKYYATVEQYLALFGSSSRFSEV